MVINGKDDRLPGVNARPLVDVTGITARSWNKQPFLKSVRLKSSKQGHRGFTLLVNVPLCSKSHNVKLLIPAHFQQTVTALLFCFFLHQMLPQKNNMSKAG